MMPNSLRTLFITKEVPYPPRGGVSLRNWQNMNVMMKFGEVAVFSAANWSPSQSSLPGIAIWQHCNVDLQRTAWDKLERQLWWTRPLGDPDADWAYAREAAGELDRLMAEFKPDIVIFEQVWLHRYLAVVKRHPCRIILDNHNVEAHLFQQKDRSSENARSRLKARIQFTHLRNSEKVLSLQSDRVWVCSEEDADLLEQWYGKNIPTDAIPNGVDVSSYDSIRSGQCSLPEGLEKKQRNILFLGQLSYSPNTVAAELLISQIYPQLKQIYADCRLLLVGRVPTKMMLEAAEKDPDIVVPGSVPDVRPYLAAASVMVVPLRQGGGTRLKILEAFAAGCPVISTTKGAEGLKAKDGEHLLIGDEIDAIVKGVCQIWSDAALGAKLASAAYELVKAEYSWEAVSQKVEPSIRALFG